MISGYFPHYFPSTFVHQNPTKDSSEEETKAQTPSEDIEQGIKSREVEKIRPK